MWTIQELKQQCKKIHFFGLGFIQLKLDDHLRLHFYTTKFSPIVEDTEVHDHRYDFTSKILLGSLTNYVHRVSFPERNKVYLRNYYTYNEVSCDPEKPIKEKSKDCFLSYPNVYEYNKGDVYHMEFGKFHKVRTKEDTITLILRSDYKQEFAHVIREDGLEAVCPFSKKLPEEELWQIVEEMWTKLEKNG